jgi:hypothetical protein
MGLSMAQRAHQGAALREGVAIGAGGAGGSSSFTIVAGSSAHGRFEFRQQLAAGKLLASWASGLAPNNGSRAFILSSASGRSIYRMAEVAAGAAWLSPRSATTAPTT